MEMRACCVLLMHQARMLDSQLRGRLEKRPAAKPAIGGVWYGGEQPFSPSHQHPHRPASAMVQANGIRTVGGVLVAIPTGSPHDICHQNALVAFIIDKIAEFDPAQFGKIAHLPDLRRRGFALPRECCLQPHVPRSIGCCHGYDLPQNGHPGCAST